MSTPIDITIQQPTADQFIMGMAKDKLWVEYWNKYEPLGTMTHWKPCTQEQFNENVRMGSKAELTKLWELL